MRLIIVRHAQTEANVKELAHGISNSNLTTLGKKQAQKLAERLSKMKIDVIYSSDLGRCKETIAPLLKMKNIPVIYTREIREKNYGIFEDKPGAQYTEWANKNGGFSIELKIPEGESNDDVIKRTGKFLSKLMDKEKGKTILIVAHGGSKRALLMNLFDRKDDNYYQETREISKNTALTIVNVKDDGKHHVESFYSIEHLEDL